jgi:acyl-CoA synthetase (AMP-forming)/AMP-acid ligase II
VEVLYGTQLIGECAAFGVPHATLGQAVVAVVTGSGAGAPDVAQLQALCRQLLPAYMVPAHIETREGPLPRNANGKIDRKTICADYRRATEEMAS